MTSPGAAVGPYVVLDRLGAGGMGEVYLARDPRLERDVALKMLPAGFAGDAVRMARFRREALALAANNHPNIATVFGFEEPSPGLHVLVLEHVAGETLESRLARGALPLTEALRVCLEVAEALEAAHKRGVIHRDLKPGNIMLGSEGIVKVLDFGLAASATAGPCATPPSPANAVPGPPSAGVEPASARGGQEAHTIVTDGASEVSGTPGYMSPEQVRGLPQDARTDVFAFGCVLYECLTGERAFPATTHHETIAAVLERSPDWQRMPAETPRRIRELLPRCLEKDAERRPAEMRDVRIELEEALGIRRASALLAGEAAREVPNNLPRQTTTFVGRERAIEECRGLLGAARLVTITGIGGGGKTRLALRVAETLLSEYPDGVTFVDLAPLSDPERVSQAMAAAMGVREAPGMAMIETVAQHVGDKRMLLVLDNCEHLLEACASHAQALLQASSELHILATSREGLGVRGERTYVVPPMLLPRPDESRDVRRAETYESVRLFVDRAKLAARDFTLSKENAAAVVEICRRLDGIPLAIELAASRVRVLSVEQIRARLDDRFRLLSGGSKTALPRHQTLLATIQWSYDLLRPEEQALLRALSVFAGGWTLDAAVSVCAAGRDEFEVLDLLTRLEEKSLMVVERSDEGEPRYHLLDTVRQYGRELLERRGERDALERAHRDWFLMFAENASGFLMGPDQALWLDRLEAEKDNLRTAFEWCLTRDPDAQNALRMASATQWFWVIRGYLAEASAGLGATIARARDAEPSSLLASVLHAAGNVAFRLDNYDLARQWYERALAIREKIGERRAVAGSLGSLGNVAQYQGRFAEALEFFGRSLEINRELGNKLWEAANLNCLGNCFRHAGDLAASREYLYQAVALNREIGNRNGEGTSLDGLGSLLLEAGDPPGARTAFEQGLAIARELGNVHEEAATLSNLARVAKVEGDAVQARSFFADALRMMRRLGETYAMAACLEELADLAVRENPEGAVRILAAADSLRRAIGAPGDAMERGMKERGLASARSLLGAKAFAAAWERGSGMSTDEAIEEALGGTCPGAT